MIAFDWRDVPAPEPEMEFGLYHYRCVCPECWYSCWSDIGMDTPERHYHRHHYFAHQFIDPSDVR